MKNIGGVYGVHIESWADEVGSAFNRLKKADLSRAALSLIGLANPDGCMTTSEFDYPYYDGLEDSEREINLLKDGNPVTQAELLINEVHEVAEGNSRLRDLVRTYP